MDYEEPIRDGISFIKPCEPFLQGVKTNGGDNDSANKINTTDKSKPDYPSLSLLKALESIVDSALSPDKNFLKKETTNSPRMHSLALVIGPAVMQYTEIGHSFDFSNKILENFKKTFKSSEIKETITSWLVRVNIIKLRHIVGQGENVYMIILIGNKLFKTSVKKNGTLKYDEVN